MHHQKYATPILRLGLGIVFFVFGIDKFIHTDYWMVFVPQPILYNGIIPFTPFMFIQGAIEALIGVLLIIGLWRRYAAAIAALILTPIIILMFTVGAYDIALRDLGLLSIAIVLVISADTSFSLDTIRHHG